VAGAQVDLKRVPETMSDELFRSAGGKVNQPAAPVAAPAELANYDAIIFVTGTRFGNMTGQMRSATQHGGQESTLLTFHPTLLHHGMIVVGLPYAEQRQMGLDEINGGTPYGASTITGGKGERMPSEQELGWRAFRVATSRRSQRSCSGSDDGRLAASAPRAPR
jgi:NAD(P)H dehydrogenase (quinone)